MSFLLHVGATAICPHGGQISVISANARVTVSGQPIATLADVFTVAGCAFVVGTVPQPCLTVQWLVPATRVTVNGQPVILQTSSGLCQGAAPQGPPNVIVTQVRVSGT